MTTKQLKITLKGSKEVVERVASYIKSVLERNTSSRYDECLEDYTIE